MSHNSGILRTRCQVKIYLRKRRARPISAYLWLLS